jgi:hypothetical protein
MYVVVPCSFAAALTTQGRNKDVGTGEEFSVEPVRAANGVGVSEQGVKTVVAGSL